MLNEQIPRDGIAVIGLAGRFPGARDVGQFWNSLCQAEECLAFGKGGDPDSASSSHYVDCYGELPGFDEFDAEFFGINMHDALLLDPQCRVFLEEAWKALEDSGYLRQRSRVTTGVFAGSKASNYLGYYCGVRPQRPPTPFEASLFAEPSQLVTRVAYHLDLHGPALYVQSACSTSIAAISQACNSLLAGECDLALAGAVTLLLPPRTGYTHRPGMIYSSDGHTRAFDASASGTVLTSGVGVVVLKPLADAIRDRDRVYATILSVATNNDGRAKVGFTAPSIQGQAEVIERAISKARITADSLSYIEAHGTATLVGDPIEVAGLTRAFRKFTARKEFCGLGSVKTNIGHLDAAAGMAGFIKTALALHHRTLPGQLHYSTPNPKLGLAASPFYIVDTTRPWHSDTPRTAGVSAFGMGGSNAHLILQEFNHAVETIAQELRPQQASDPQLVVISAHTAASLDALRSGIGQQLLQPGAGQLPDVAFTLQTSREQFAYRIAVTGSDASEVAAKLNEEQCIEPVNPATRGPVFMFPGQGSIYFGAGRELYHRLPCFRKAFDECRDIVLEDTGLDLRGILFMAAAEWDLYDTYRSQLCLFALEYALAQAWLAAGVTPSALIGHSLGEYVAACLAGLFSLDGALRLVAARGRCMRDTTEGRMLAVMAPLATVQQLISPELSIAAHNAPESYVVSGSVAAIEAFKNKCPQDIRCLSLHVQRGFHSSLMDPAVEEFARAFDGVGFGELSIPLISNLDGLPATSQGMASSHYWQSHLRGSVQFSAGIQNLIHAGHSGFLEVGPGTTLVGLARQHSAPDTPLSTFTSLTAEATEKGAELKTLLVSLGKQWSSGVDVDFGLLHAGKTPAHVSLPTYVFSPQRFWPCELDSRATQPQPAASRLPRSNSKRSDPMSSIEEALLAIWRDVLDIAQIPSGSDFFEINGTSVLALDLLERISERFGVNLQVSWVFRHRTVQAQAAALRAHKALNSPKEAALSLTLTRLSAPKRLFLVHPSAAGAEVYADFANHLDGDVEVIAFDHPLIRDAGARYGSIEDLARSYVDELVSGYPADSYSLGGWSLGGVIAYEMARQLTAREFEVSGLYLIDSAVTSQSDCALWDEALNVLSRHLPNAIANAPSTHVTKARNAIYNDYLLMKNYSGYALSNFPARLYKATKLTYALDGQKLDQAEIEVLREHVQALFASPDNGWSKYLSTMSIVPLSADHFELLRGPVVSRLAEDLRPLLRQ